MNGCIKYFESGDKNMSFFIKDDKVWEKWEIIWDVIKNPLGIKFHRKPIYEQKYLKAKVREFDFVIKTNKLNFNFAVILSKSKHVLVHKIFIFS